MIDGNHHRSWADAPERSRKKSTLDDCFVAPTPERGLDITVPFHSIHRTPHTRNRYPVKRLGAQLESEVGNVKEWDIGIVSSNPTWTP